MILKNLHKLQIQTLFYNEKSEWTQIFLIRPDFFIAPNIYAALHTTTHNSSQLCFKYHSNPKKFITF